MKSKRTAANQKVVPPQDRLKEVLDYDPNTGVFKWRRGSGKNQSRQAGSITRKGYRIIHVDGVFLVAHRLAWLWCYNAWPVSDVDHVNGVKDDNRVANLRLASRSQNNANSKVRANSKSGVKGVRWHKGNGLWQARMTVAGKERGLGYFKDLSDAADAYKAAAIKQWGEFASF